MAVGIITALVSLAGAYMQYKGAQEQAAAQKKEIKARQAQADLQARQKRRSAFREAIVRQAEARQGGQNAGSSGGSSTQQAVGALASTGNANMRNVNQGMHLSQQVSKAQTQAVNAQSTINQGSMIAAVAPAIGNIAGMAAPQGYA